jgi:four helix bundle protein
LIDYRKYNVWEKSNKLVLEIYSKTNGFPKSGQFNLISQINSAAVSVPTNIAEGCGRETQKELIRFLYISSGSAHELVYLIFLSTELKYLNNEDSKKIISEIKENKKNVRLFNKENKLNTLKLKTVNYYFNER